MRTFTLFELAAVGPAGASDIALTKLQHDPFEREFLYSRWVRPILFDPRIAQRGDRVVFHVNERETFARELTSVTVVEDGAIWFGRFPGDTSSILRVAFTRPMGSKDALTLTKATLIVLAQRRGIEVTTTRELPGWGLLREPKPGSGSWADNSDDTGGAAWRERVRRQIELQREADEEARRERERR